MQEWAVAAILVRDIPNELNIQTFLIVLNACNKSEAERLAVLEAKESHPDYSTQSIVSVEIKREE
jgi:hypothetical protein